MTPRSWLLPLASCVLFAAACDLGVYGGPAGGGDTPDGGAVGGGPLPDAGFPLGCNLSCHGDEANPAPPRALAGAMEVTNPGVGAHRNHTDPNPTWHRAVRCEDCHQVPSNAADPGHMDDGDNKAELTFSAIATSGGAEPTWNGATCDNVYCHGATLTGGALRQPTWTIVDDSQDACGNCHGAPPPPPHDQSEDCGSCHPTVQPGSLDFLDPTRHINGIVELSDGQACDSCHGSGGVSAPPTDLAGNTARTAQGVGAHRQHLGASPWHRELTCSNCHSVPTEVSSPGHLDGDNLAELTFDVLNPAATYDRGAARCDNLYCHGNGRDSTGSITWTTDPTLECSSCHATTAGGATGLQGRHGKHFNEDVRECRECHESVVNAAMDVIAPDLHVNGTREVKMRTGGTWDPATRRCSNMACHEDERW